MEQQWWEIEIEKQLNTIREQRQEAWTAMQACDKALQTLIDLRNAMKQTVEREA